VVDLMERLRRSLDQAGAKEKPAKTAAKAPAKARGTKKKRRAA
jgi:hypothetical protein